LILLFYVDPASGLPYAINLCLLYIRVNDHRHSWLRCGRFCRLQQNPPRQSRFCRQCAWGLICNATFSGEGITALMLIC